MKLQIFSFYENNPCRETTGQKINFHLENLSLYMQQKKNPFFKLNWYLVIIRCKSQGSMKRVQRLKEVLAYLQPDIVCCVHYL